MITKTMPTRNRGLSLIFLLILGFSPLFIPLPLAAETEAARPVRVLYINAYHRGYSWSDDIENSLMQGLQDFPGEVELSIEHLDNRRFTLEGRAELLVAEFKAKYADYPFDLIITSDNAAFDFAQAYRERLFPGVPMVFCGYNNLRPSALEGMSNITGVNEEVDYSGTIDLALRVHPDAHTLAFVVSTADVTNKQIYETVQQRVVPQYRDRYEVVQLKDLSIQEIRHRLNQLPKNSLLFIMGETSDRGEGRALSPVESARLITGVSPFPAYSFWAFQLDAGVLGGSMVTGSEQGRAAAQMGLRILSGTPPDDIPPIMRSPTRFMFDHRVMKRFGITEERLPGNRTIVNQPKTLWYQYHRQILTGISALVIETLLIVALIVAMRQRNRALTLARKRQAESQRLTEELEQRVKERTAALLLAEGANRAKSVFLANMSHELRTPLNAILGFSEMLGRAPDIPAPHQVKIATIHHSGEHLLALINQVLDLSRIEAGRMKLEPEPFNLPALLQDIGETFALRAADAGLRFELELMPDLPHAVRADAGKLRQLLGNLLDNAIKFTPQGGVTLRARTLPSAGDPAWVALRLEVQDSGPGIPPEQRERIFEPFFQGQAGHTGPEGSGLGLAICKTFVELAGGRVGVSSTPGRGALFQVELPLALAQVGDIEDQQTARPMVLGLAPGQPAWRILVVENSPGNRLLLTSLLTQAGFEVREAEDGEQAVAEFERCRPHFIWMDMRMPVLDGFEATRRIRALPGGDQVKIVAITASHFKEQRLKIQAAGCDEVVHKPYQSQEIFDMLSQQLGTRYRHEEPQAPPPSEPPVVSAEALATLPQAQRQALRAAALCLNKKKFDAALAEVQDQTLTKGLAALARSYQFNRIVVLIDQILEVK